MRAKRALPELTRRRAMVIKAAKGSHSWRGKGGGECSVYGATMVCGSVERLPLYGVRMA